MARQLKQKHKHKSAPRFAGRIEQLEDRRVMAADMPLELMGASDPWVGDAPPLEQHVVAPPLEQHGLGDADFWIDPATQMGFDEYLQGVEKFLAEAHNLTGWFNVKNNYGFTGLGQTVAVIDSGVAYDHFALGGGFGSNYRVVGGWDFTEENDANPYDDGPSGGHGTHVSGIIGSTDATRTGVAPGVDLVGLRVFNDAGQGFFSWMENALRWIHTNRNAFENPITAVNMSVGVSSWNSASIPLWTTLEDEFAQLKADGIFISVSAGNSFTSFNAPGLSYPAASPNVVPVMATDDAGNMSYFSQRLGRAIAAPGQNIVSTVPDYAGNNNGVADDFASMGGTSMAAPYVAGASVLIRQAMQFVGMTNINQDTIYNHMMATADSFYDSVTAQTYKRLNLWRAIDTLMPADDFGSTTADAYNLGTLSAPAAMNGKLAKLTDVDCFRFTAASSGAVTFSATCSAGMTPTWQVWNATALPSASGTVSFNVVAGQSYTIGLSSSCLGSYTLASTMSTPFTFTDWGSIASSEMDNVAVSGEKWFRVTATRTGLLTAIGAFNPAGGNVSIGFYNTNQQLLTAGATSGGEARADLNATAGTSYYLRVAGTNADVDFKLANLVSQTGSTVTVEGTANADAYLASTGSFNWLSVNGVGYSFALAASSQMVIDGAGGNDSLVFYGSAGAETVTLRATGSTFAGAGLTLTAHNIENQSAYSGGGADVAYLYDSAGNDGLQLAPRYASFTYAGGGSSLASGFGQVTAFASTGTDYVDLYDSTGNDTATMWADRTLLTGSGYVNEVRGFDLVAAHAWSGGVDRVTFYDSAGNDTYSGWSNKSSMTGAAYDNRADGFDQALAAASAGGSDVANLYDSVGNDGLQVAAKYGSFSYAGGLTATATGFGQLNAFSTVGTDYVDLWDTAGNDTVSLWSDRALMVAGGTTTDARGFAIVAAHGSTGADVANLYDSAGNDGLQVAARFGSFSYGSGRLAIAAGFGQINAFSTAGTDYVDLWDTAGNDTVSLWSDRALMVAGGTTIDARGFAIVAAHGSAGADIATLYDSAGNDGLQFAPRYASFAYAGGNKAFALGFGAVTAYSSSGFDYVDLYDSTGNDTATMWANRTLLTGSGYVNEVRGFDLVAAHALYGGLDRVTFNDSAGDDSYSGWFNKASMTGAAYDNRADGFDQAFAAAGAGGVDRAHVYGSSNADSLTGSGSQAAYSGAGFSHTLSGFDYLTSHGMLGNDVVNFGATDYLFTQLGA